MAWALRKRSTRIKTAGHLLLSLLSASLGMVFLAGCVTPWEPPAVQTIGLEILWSEDELAQSEILLVSLTVLSGEGSVLDTIICPSRNLRGAFRRIPASTEFSVVVQTLTSDGTVLKENVFRVGPLRPPGNYYAVLSFENATLDTPKPLPSAQLASDSLYFFGKTFYDRGAYASSATWLYRSLSATSGETATSKLPEILYYLGRSWYETGVLDSAAQIFQSYLDLFADGSLAGNCWYFLGRSYYRMSPQDSEKAAYAFEMLLRLFPESRYAIDSRYYAGRAHFSLRNYDSAGLHFAQFIGQAHDTDSKIEQARFYQARSKYSLSLYAESIELFREYVQRYTSASSWQSARLYLGKSFYYGGHTDSSVVYCSALIEEPGEVSDDIRAEALLVRGKCRMRDSLTWADAGTDFGRVLSEFPLFSGCDEAQYQLGVSHYERARNGQSSYDAAIEELVKVEQNYATSSYIPSCWYYLGRCYRYLKEHSMAAKYFEGVITRYPQSGFVDNSYYYLIRSMLSSGSGTPNSECARAIEQFTSMQQLFPIDNQYLIDGRAELVSGGCLQ